MPSVEISLQRILSQLLALSPSSPEAARLLRSAKHALVSLNALLPSDETPPTHVALARDTLETGALLAVRAQDTVEFKRYWQQLQPFYNLPASWYPRESVTGHKNKITGLYLALLLIENDYAAFHSVLEALRNSISEATIEGDPFLRYPVMLEQWLMEGTYNRAWAALEKDIVPSKEFAIFSQMLEHAIRSEVASCSERSYEFVSVSTAAKLLFLNSEGDVFRFARSRGWVVRDGHIYFPAALHQGEHVGSKCAILNASAQFLEETIGYARELETIV